MITLALLRNAEAGRLCRGNIYLFLFKKTGGNK